MTPQPGKQTIVINILPNIATNRGNQTMKFVQLIVYNMRKIFLKKSYTNVVEKRFLDPFPKHKN